jgi:hypothetical protein
VNPYNDLLSVEDADVLLRGRAEFDRFLEWFAPAAAEHGMQEIVGACLLHRHFTLNDGEVIVEKPGEWNEVPALISAPQRTMSADAAPYTWRVGADTNLEALEFSEDPALRDGVSSIDQDFVSLCGEVLHEMRLTPLLGLTLLQRDSLPLLEGHQYLEETDSGRSIVVLVPEEQDHGESITTVWAAADRMGCSVYNTCHQRNICHVVDNQHRNVLGHVTERGHHTPGD